MSSHGASQPSALGPFLRMGLDGGCAACLQPIADHVDARGQWLGCQASQSSIGPRVSLRLMPDRRLPPLPWAPPVPPPAAVSSPRTTAKRVKRAMPTHALHDGHRKTVPAPPARMHTVYHAKMNRHVWELLPPADRRVYTLICKAGKRGVTREYLLDALKARHHMGRVDGATRRLCAKGVVKRTAKQ